MAKVKTLPALLILFTAVWTGPLGTQDTAYGSHGAPHGTLRVWDIGNDPTINGLDPQETVSDQKGLTNHVGKPALVVSMQNTQGGYSGLLFWNPEANLFKSFPVTGGNQFAVDVDRSRPAPASSPPGTFGGGDVWVTEGNNDIGLDLYVNFRGSDDFRRWDIGVDEAGGIRVNPANGKVYVGNLSGGIYELDPATNNVRAWATGNTPWQLLIHKGNIFATADAASGGSPPDQILRLDPRTNKLTRWNLPAGGFDNGPDLGFYGVTNGITKSLDGKLWFSETDSGEIGQLNLKTNVIREFQKQGVDNPQGIASSGANKYGQIYFAEGSAPGAIGVLSSGLAASTSTTITPTTKTVAPTIQSMTPSDFIVEPEVATIQPSSMNTAGINRPGTVLFPLDLPASKPVGITPAVVGHSIYGSAEGTDDSKEPSDLVFKLTSTMIFSPLTETKLSIEKGPEKVRAFGTMKPPHPGDKMKVTLERKRDGSFQVIVTKRPALSQSGAFASSFERPRPGTCRIVARFPGDIDHKPSQAANTFQC